MLAFLLMALRLETMRQCDERYRLVYIHDAAYKHERHVCHIVASRQRMEFAP